ncbi:sigma-70 family RNA polymerase sigma factor [Kamptonema formosum]|uniref:sigma-70 family RNA polymerase sigma factor n=1 Tax=Kamptonema formosum TaxID=331992 RepID=UPI003510920D
MVKSLFHHSDQELLTLFQRHPDLGKFFTAIFARYSPIVYTLISHSAKSVVQADYLFALTWRHIFHELRDLDLRQDYDTGGKTSALSLQNWLINTTALCINSVELPPVESIHYSLQAAPPPLWCYVQQSLDLLLPLQRVAIVMAQTFHWSETRIAAYLQAEGENLTPADVPKLLEEGYRLLEAQLPADIHAIYLDGQTSPGAEGSAVN